MYFLDSYVICVSFIKYGYNLLYCKWMFCKPQILPQSHTIVATAAIHFKGHISHIYMSAGYKLHPNEINHCGDANVKCQYFEEPHFFTDNDHFP